MVSLEFHYSRYLMKPSGLLSVISTTQTNPLGYLATIECIERGLDRTCSAVLPFSQIAQYCYKVTRL